MKNEYRGLTFLHALTLVFIHLKLSDSVDWCWSLVLLPLFVLIALKVVAALIEHAAKNSS